VRLAGTDVGVAPPGPARLARLGRLGSERTVVDIMTFEYKNTDMPLAGRGAA
jgi:hypothetical protein